VLAATAAIDRGEFDKVVLAREVTVRANRPFSPEYLLGRLRQLHPSCLAFSVDGILGASPELICRRSGAAVTSSPLAGTVGRSGDPEQDARLAAALLSSVKDRAEHSYVVDAIRDGLAPFSDRVNVPAAPHLLELRNVVHLATTITASLRSDQRPVPSCLELVAALHPTPAVGGVPRDAALTYLTRTEELDRDRYAGPIGYQQAGGDGEFWLAIRSAILDGASARLLAGVGIVEGSDPDSELAETQLKLQALLAAAVRP
jgi:menaquinone-specific isochorismate synthase